MKKLVIALALGLFSLPILAQQGPRKGAGDHNPEQRAEMMIQKMAEELDLTDDQIEQLKPILEEFHKERAEAQKADKERHDAFREKLAKVLNEEQMKKLDEKMKERRGKMRKHRHQAEPKPEPQDE